MPHPRTTPPLVVRPAERTDLDALARSHTAPARRVARAQILCAYLDGASIPAIARQLHRPAPTVRQCIPKAVAYGPRHALDDAPPGGSHPAHYAGSPGLDNPTRHLRSRPGSREGIAW